MKVRVSFRQSTGLGDRSLEKVIELAAFPVPGCLIEYEDGWGMADVVTSCERGLHPYVTADEVGLDGYGVQFSEEEIAELVRLGWKKT